MGFSASGALVVLFIGLLVSASYLFPALEAGVERTHDATDAAEVRLLRMQNTDFVVDDAQYDTSQTPDTLMIRATNTGTTALRVERVDVLVDGVYVDATVFDDSIATQPNATTQIAAVLDGGDHTEPVLWLPGETVAFGWDANSSTPTRAVVVVETGLSRGTTVTEVN